MVVELQLHYSGGEDEDAKKKLAASISQVTRRKMYSKQDVAEGFKRIQASQVKILVKVLAKLRETPTERVQVNTVIDYVRNGIFVRKSPAKKMPESSNLTDFL
jgi:hypothetical protein